MQVPQGCRSPGCCWRSACEDTFEGDEYVASAGTGVSGWAENNFDGLVGGSDPMCTVPKMLASAGQPSLHGYYGDWAVYGILG